MELEDFETKDGHLHDLFVSIQTFISIFHAIMFLRSEARRAAMQVSLQSVHIFPDCNSIGSCAL